MTPRLTRFGLLNLLVLCLVFSAGPRAMAGNNNTWHWASGFAQSSIAPTGLNLWGVESGPHQVVVAVIDSGIIAEHPALQGRLLPGYDMQSSPHNKRGERSDNYTPEPANQKCNDVAVSNAYRTHGTEVASLIVGNGFGNVWGVSPGALVLPVRIMGPCPINRHDIIDAIAWAAGFEVPGVPLNPHPAQIINLSFAGGGFSCDVRTQALIDRVVDRGIFVVAAGGNRIRKQLQEPANCRGVVSVGTVSPMGDIEVYSARGSQAILQAPTPRHATNLNVNWSLNRLRVATEEPDLLDRPRLVGAERGIGTSFTTPLVSGFIALVLSHQPNTSPRTLVQSLFELNRQVQAEGWGACPCTQGILRLSQKEGLVQ
jgi:serine protease